MFKKKSEIEDDAKRRMWKRVRYTRRTTWMKMRFIFININWFARILYEVCKLKWPQPKVGATHAMIMTREAFTKALPP